ncbi:MAG: hypothetical protein U0835_20890 [Isosphaeraceae bacterium]
MPTSATSPYASPSMNPFLNPYLAQMQNSPESAAMYFLATQQARGGIGSGKIGGPSAELPGRRSDPRRTSGGTDAGKDYPSRGASNVPGAGAYRFFNRTAARSNGNAPEVGLYYNRQTRHFPGNGR